MREMQDNELLMSVWVNIEAVPAPARREVAFYTSMDLNRMLPEAWDTKLSEDKAWWQFWLIIPFEGRVDTPEGKAGAATVSLSYLYAALTTHPKVMVPTGWPQYTDHFRYWATMGKEIDGAPFPKPRIVWQPDLS